jgi:hypothetical protein
MRRFREFGFCIAVCFAVFQACEPDLGPLSSEYGSGGSSDTGGKGSETGGTGTSTGGSLPGSGGSAETGGNASEGGMVGEGGMTAEGGTGGEGGMGTVIPESCTDLRRSADESDVDCGGTSPCQRCEVDARCTRHSDCETEICLESRCSLPSCRDGIQNQTETGPDCGGVCAPASLCDMNLGCKVNGDCVTGYCVNSICADHCDSKRRESDETDVDCGGATCPACANEKACLKITDCESGVCKNNVCKAPSCDDDVLNQDESATDCGGVCDACRVNDRCNKASDCETFVCTTNRCAEDVSPTTLDVIDDFEDGNLVITPVKGRTGNWFHFQDSSTAGTYTLAPWPSPRSDFALRYTGSGYKEWGSGIGFDFDNPGADDTTKVLWDASAYKGITFWAIAAAPFSVNVQIADRYTHKAGGICTPPCEHFYGRVVQIGTQWERRTVLFKDMTLDAGTIPAPPPGGIDTTGVVMTQFFFPPNATVDLTIDDVALVLK